MTANMLTATARSRGVLAAILVLIAVVPPAHSSVTPGETVGPDDVARLEHLVSPGVLQAVRRGMEMRIVASAPIAWAPAYRAATEKYAAQVRLSPEGTLENYVAGMPFPEIDPNDPQAAVKIMWNYSYPPLGADDADLRYFDSDTGSLRDGEPLDVERHFLIEHLKILRFVGRTEVPPMPALEPNRRRVAHKAGQYPLVEPTDLRGAGGVSWRYLDPKKPDDTWIYLPALRRVRRLSSAQRSDALFAQDIDVDSYGGYAGQIPWFEFRFLGEREMLAPMRLDTVPVTFCAADGGATVCPAPWEKRHLYVIEGKPKMAGYAYGKRVIYVDTQSFAIPYSDIYDRAGELWKVLIQFWAYDNRPGPAATTAVYPYKRLFLVGISMLDLQLGHATRVSLPGQDVEEKDCWYLNQGEVGEVTEDWFSVAALVRAGH